MSIRIRPVWPTPMLTETWALVRPMFHDWGRAMLGGIAAVLPLTPGTGTPLMKK